MQQRYDRLCSSKCDMSNHLPYLLKYGKGCERIVEFGVRGGCSMTAWLLCKPKSILGVDIDLSNLDDPAWAGEDGLRKRFEDYARFHKIEFKLREASSLEIEPIKADLLFIDSNHNNEHANQELERHGDNVGRYILLHDIGDVSEAVDNFVGKRKNWIRLPDIQDWPGLGILKRKDFDMKPRHKTISPEEVTDEMLSGWKKAIVSARQRRLTEKELKKMYSGKPLPIFTLLAKLIKESYNKNSTILEIGCSTGYYYEILNHLLKKKINYTGVDYSEAMIGLAKRHYPKTNFVVADGAELPFNDKQFSIVISGSILIHNLNYPKHIKETTRVAKDRIIIHRSLLCKKRPTYFLKKNPYGVEILEVCFNENELLHLFEKEGWIVKKTIEYISNENRDEYQSSHLLVRNKNDYERK